jgi:hypothetical protein
MQNFAFQKRKKKLDVLLNFVKLYKYNQMKQQKKEQDLKKDDLREEESTEKREDLEKKLGEDDLEEELDGDLEEEKEDDLEEDYENREKEESKEESFGIDFSEIRSESENYLEGSFQEFYEKNRYSDYLEESFQNKKSIFSKNLISSNQLKKNNIYRDYIMKFWTTLVKPENFLRTLILIRDISIVMKDKLKDIDLDTHKKNPDFILYVCNIIENSYTKKNIEDKKINKKDIFFLIFKELNIEISEDDKKVIDDIIEHLHSSRRIRKISNYILLKYFINFFLKK